MILGYSDWVSGWSAFGAEEVAHQGGTFVGEDAGGDGGAGMEGCGGIGGVGGYDGAVAAFVVGCAVDYAAELAPCYCSGAHQAGFYGDVECGALQVFASEGLCGCCYGEHFGVGCDVAEGFCHVVAAAYDAAVGYDDGSDGHFVGGKGGAGFLEGEAHVVYVGFVLLHFFGFFGGIVDFARFVGRIESVRI